MITICPTHVGMNRTFANMAISSQAICPTHVGMNRGRELRKGYGSHLPHARGDEPYASRNYRKRRTICPTHVGMNRCSCNHVILPFPSAPRTWG